MKNGNTFVMRFREALFVVLLWLIFILSLVTSALTDNNNNEIVKGSDVWFYLSTQNSSTISISTATPPCPSTVCGFPDAVHEGHTTSFRFVRYVGVSYRTYWDYRSHIYGFQTKRCHVYKVVFSDEEEELEAVFNVMEFSRAVSHSILRKLSQAYGRIPLVYRGGAWRLSVVGPGQGSGGGTTADGAINLHVDFMEGLGPLLEEFLMKAAIMVSWENSPELPSQAVWKAAMESDYPHVVSQYARHDDRVDLAETVVAYVATVCSSEFVSEETSQRIYDTIPNRMSTLFSVLGENEDWACPRRKIHNNNVHGAGEYPEEPLTLLELLMPLVAVPFPWIFLPP